MGIVFIRVALLTSVSLLPSMVSGQFLPSISFQGYLADNDGNPIDGTKNITAKLFSSPVAPVALWTRDYTAVEINQGVFRLSLSSGTPDLTTISFQDRRFLELTVDGEVIAGRTKLEGAPYAMGLRLPIEVSENVDGNGEAAFHITNDAVSGNNFAIFGESKSTVGNGVRGWATASSGEAYGVYGESASSSGRGVFGRATAPSGVAYGVYGLSISASGRGVYGRATSLTGTTYGVYAENASEVGQAVYGFATSSVGPTRGVVGYVNSPSGIGVHGTGGVGVEGHVGPDATLGAGVLGSNANATGYGGHFYGPVGAYVEGSSNALPDLILGGNDDGRIFSSQSHSSSDIWLHSNDAVVIVLDNDGGGEDSDFEVRDKDGLNIFNVDESGNVTADGVLVHSSDRDRKEGIVPVDVSAILEEVARLPISTWRFKGETETHLGPMAQDFYSAFALGEDDRHIAGADADGVALAAIQALFEIVKRQQAEIELLKLDRPNR